MAASSASRWATRSGFARSAHRVAHSGFPEQRGELRELPVVADRHRDHAVAHRISRVRHDVRMAVAEAAARPRRTPGDSKPRSRASPGSYRTATPRRAALARCGDAPAARRVSCCTRACPCRCRRWPRRISSARLGVAADAHEARLRLQDEVVAGQPRLRPGRAIARDRAANHARRMRLQPLVRRSPTSRACRP